MNWNSRNWTRYQRRTLPTELCSNNHSGGTWTLHSENENLVCLPLHYGAITTLEVFETSIPERQSGAITTLQQSLKASYRNRTDLISVWKTDAIPLGEWCKSHIWNRRVGERHEQLSESSICESECRICRYFRYDQMESIGIEPIRMGLQPIALPRMS